MYEVVETKINKLLRLIIDTNADLGYDTTSRCRRRAHHGVDCRINDSHRLADAIGGIRGGICNGARRFDMNAERVTPAR